MATSVLRDLSGPLEFLPRQAFAGGADFSHYFGSRSYRLEGNLLASQIRGSAAAIGQAQTASARYFQRPDNDHAELDPAATSLSGHAGSLRFTRTKSGSPIRFQTGAAWRSPGFEINDLGFMNRADEINQFGWAAYQIRNPVGVFRRVEMNVNEWLDWDFGGQLLRQAANTNAHAWFTNNWHVGGSLTREFERISNTDLRGGPSSRWPGSWQYEVYGSTDSRKPLFAETGVNGTRGDQGSQSARQLWADLTYRPTNALTLTVSPSLSRSQPQLQYIDTRSSAGQARYLFGRLDQKTSAITLRLDWALAPNLTVQLYGAPFVSRGRYSELSRITDPRADAYTDRFAVYGPDQVRLAGGSYLVDEDRDGRTDFSLDQPDFDVREFNSTLVVRWEYRPGSSLYVVWSQGRSDETLRMASAGFGRGLRELWDAPAHDVFLVKFSKWFAF
jgi:hypothetical protein